MLWAKAHLTAEEGRIAEAGRYLVHSHDLNIAAHSHRRPAARRSLRRSMEHGCSGSGKCTGYISMRGISWKYTRLCGYKGRVVKQGTRSHSDSAHSGRAIGQGAEEFRGTSTRVDNLDVYRDLIDSDRHEFVRARAAKMRALLGFRPASCLPCRPRTRRRTTTARSRRRVRGAGMEGPGRWPSSPFGAQNCHRCIMALQVIASSKWT